MDVHITPPPVAAPGAPPTISDTPPPVVVAAAAAAAGQAASASEPPTIPIHDTGEFGMDEWTLPPEPPKSKAVWLLPIALLVAVVAFWGFVYFGGNSSTTTTVAAAPTTTSSTSTTTTAAVLAEETTSTSSSTTTTTVPYPAADAWEASGSAIPTPELTLKAAGIGPLELGASLQDIAGQLVASLGEAQAVGDSDLCLPDEAYWLRWGPLTAIFDGYEPDSSFVSYRFEDTGSGTSNPTLRTLSGLELGQTIEELQATYSFYTVTFEVINDQEHFRLVDGGDLLLWGPVSSTDASGTVLGIYSPTPCPAG